MTRFKAAGIHLGISALIALVVTMIMLGVWYPGAYFKLMGGTMLLLLIVGVDVGVGPIITFAVFKSGKPGLKFDLTVIAVLQIAALAYGGYVIFSARPAYTVFVKDMLRVAAANEINEDEFSKARRPEWRKSPIDGPALVAADFPENPQERRDMLMAALAGLDLHQFPKYYVPYAERRTVILQQAKKLPVLSAVSPAHKVAVESFLRDHKRPETDFVFLPIRARMLFMTAMLDAKTAEIVDIIDLDPYGDSDKG